MTPEELRVHLRAKAEATIDEIVGQYEEQQPKTLSEIEQVAIQAGQEIKTAVLKVMVEVNRPEAGRVVCRGCGKKMRDKGKREKWVQTQAGEVRIERDYYYCESCGTGFFPL